MVLDVCEIRRLLERGDVPVQMPQPSVDVWIPTADISDIGLQDV
jgi:hypothetical protein